jgi:hypothetical protein
VQAQSVANACVGAAIGPRTSATLSNLTATATVGDVRVRWMLSTDSVPSTDDLPLSGTGAEVTLGPLASGGSRSIMKPALTIPAARASGPST